MFVYQSGNFPSKRGAFTGFDRQGGGDTAAGAEWEPHQLKAGDAGMNTNDDGENHGKTMGKPIWKPWQMKVYEGLWMNHDELGVEWYQWIKNYLKTGGPLLRCRV